MCICIIYVLYLNNYNMVSLYPLHPPSIWRGTLSLSLFSVDCFIVVVVVGCRCCRHHHHHHWLIVTLPRRNIIAACTIPIVCDSTSISLGSYVLHCGTITPLIHTSIVVWLWLVATSPSATKRYFSCFAFFFLILSAKCANWISFGSVARKATVAALTRLDEFVLAANWCVHDW